MINNAKKTAGLFKKTFKLTDINEKSLCDTIAKQGYTVVYFNAIFNNENVSQIINNLGLDDAVTRHKGFTYSNNKYRLVFINEDLSDEERLMVLAHEEGHIFLGHMSNNPIIGEDVRQEHEANEFAHYLLYPDKCEKSKMWIKKHKKLVISVCAVVLALVIGVTSYSLWSREKTYFGEYYITTTGNKYHKKDCIFVKNKDNVSRLTKQEYESGEYEPCKTCLPE